jgi:hypothetical protein
LESLRKVKKGLVNRPFFYGELVIFL